MTEETLRRLMVVQLEKAHEMLRNYLNGERSEDDLNQLKLDIGNCLAIVQAESRYVKQDWRNE